MSVSETRRKYAKQGKLIDLLNETPESRWTEKDEYCDTLLHHACRDSRNFDAFLVLVKSSLFDLNAFGQGNWTPLGICINHCLLKNVQVLCMFGCTKVTRYSKNILNCLQFKNLWTFDIVKFLISIGWKIDNSYIFGWSFYEPLYQLQKEVVKCRDVIVTLLGLKKRRLAVLVGQGNGHSLILPKLDRFLVQQELAVAIWSTRHQA